MLDDRKLEVLGAVVVDYVQSREPVGSRALVERHHLDVSPATIRNDMAVLEEEGYLTQPHTSAGRVPTDKGYRLFVDKLASVKPLSVAERRAIGSFMQGAVGVDDVVARTARLLAQLTHHVAIVQYPAPAPAELRHIELVRLAAGHLLVIVIRATGEVDQRVAECPDMDEADVTVLRGWVNGAAVGLTPGRAVEELRRLLATLDPAGRRRLAPVVESIAEMAGASTSERVVVGGVPNLARFGVEYEAMIEPLLEAIEEQVVLLRLLGESARDNAGVYVRIGAENEYTPLRETSVVSSVYTPLASSEGGYASLGVVGPTRMDYPSTMATVRAVARYVGRFLGAQTADLDVTCWGHDEH